MISKLFYSDTGRGTPIVLIHGFLETSVIWKELIDDLSQDFRVLAFDLPGFGRSPLPENIPFTLDDIAHQVNLVLRELGLKNVFLIGHSLGGYVSLAMIENNPDLFSGLCLFHSTAKADSDEKKMARTKTIDFVRKNGALAFTSNFIPPLFADADHTAVSWVRQMASATPENTVINYLGAMRDRPERLSLLKTFLKPVLFIAGELDNVIPLETLKEQVKLSTKASLQVLADVGHMGMVESPAICIKTIREFLAHMDQLRKDLNHF